MHSRHIFTNSQIGALVIGLFIVYNDLLLAEYTQNGKESRQADKIDENIEKLREWIRLEYESHPGLYDKEDVRRVVNAKWPKDWPLRRYLIHTDGDLEEAERLMDLNFKWRAAVEMNSITARDWPCEFFQLGQYSLAHARLNQSILTFDFNRHKNFPRIKTTLYRFNYWTMELVDRASSTGERPEDGWLIALNLQGAGMYNLDFTGVSLTFPFGDRFPGAIKKLYFVGANPTMENMMRFFLRFMPEASWRITRFTNVRELYRIARKRDLPRYFGGKIPSHPVGIPLVENATRDCIPMRLFAPAAGWPDEDVQIFLKWLRDVQN